MDTDLLWLTSGQHSFTHRLLMEVTRRLDELHAQTPSAIAKSFSVRLSSPLTTDEIGDVALQIRRQEIYIAITNVDLCLPVFSYTALANGDLIVEHASSRAHPARIIYRAEQLLNAQAISIDEMVDEVVTFVGVNALSVVKIAMVAHQVLGKGL